MMEKVKDFFGKSKSTGHAFLKGFIISVLMIFGFILSGSVIGLITSSLVNLGLPFLVSLLIGMSVVFIIVVTITSAICD